jgi:hypothetical protein
VERTRDSSIPFVSSLAALGLLVSGWRGARLAGSVASFPVQTSVAQRHSTALSATGKSLKEAARIRQRI